jgi:hypothetical protein
MGLAMGVHAASGLEIRAEVSEECVINSAGVAAEIIARMAQQLCAQS